MSIFEALEDPQNSQAIHEFLGSTDLKKQLLARDRLLARGPAVLSFIERSLEEPPKGSYDRGILLHNFGEIVDALAESGAAVPQSLFSTLAGELYRVGAYSDAALMFEKVSAPSDPLLHLRRGIAYYQIQNYEDAVVQFERSVELGGGTAVRAAAQRNLGAAYEKEGASEKALEAYSQALALAPTDDLVQSKVEELSDRLGRTEPAGSYWVLVGIWRPPAGFESVHFDVSAPPAPGTRIRALEMVYRRTDAPSRNNGWRQGDPVGVVAPGDRLEVLEVRRSGPEDESVWARVAQGDA